MLLRSPFAAPNGSYYLHFLFVVFFYLYFINIFKLFVFKKKNFTISLNNTFLLTKFKKKKIISFSCSLKGVMQGMRLLGFNLMEFPYNGGETR